MKAFVVLLALVACITAQANAERDIERLADRLNILETSGVRGDHYFYVKALAWLDLARDAQYQNDRSGVVTQSIAEANMLVRRIENRDREIPTQTIAIPTAQRLREDLWQKAEQFKTHKDFVCAQAATARFEVQLIAAGHADRELGWRYAKPYMQAAERLAAEAQQQMVICSAQAVPIAAWRLAPPDGAVDSVQFAAASAAIDDDNARKLEKISHALRANPDLRADLVHDQTDTFGLARAEAVRDYLVDTGVGIERIRIRPPAVTTSGRVQVATVGSSDSAAAGNNLSSARAR
jgi:outer membrane protein OmpA-like peptidoglycan-associated protein